ncbi:hypothetical protein [Bacillus sp. S/N-304-OC-R1]|uniref:hypothetical protein n=1 Tax=Bacillus sp. S/N-304-OC-R1 TaxID=2758034 RepID=UPI001C8E1531|nr:hypothetical protein [Bacillus sp. S/N-304-OC-R1]MBY0122180.1 hypothetical protein [Bacillus sp. S/N-304-OC-R1]
MARLKFEMFLSDYCTKHRGISSRFTDGKGRSTVSWWSSPPDSIDHVDITYLQGRYGNVRTKRHEEFLKQRFKEEMKRFEEYQENRFKSVG